MFGLCGACWAHIKSCLSQLPHEVSSAAMSELAPGTPVQAEERRSLTDSVSAQVSLFVELWNGRPVTLPSHSWALHRIEKAGLGPLVVINEMMANNNGIPFPFKQLVLSSSGTLMALVLNQIIDVSLLSSVWPLQTIEDLQEALRYFDQIDCDYVYVETV
ncbi:Glucose-6-phosphate isomerase [Frankliniella fusca]|uniref:Glucose-6-phosphate isomerase n=1 Tax=Frankliniella fusca TaxID=407009 RepID=A0AAE1GUS0_9NEOP|nr:Glucose-6-phosphate isomerase [Frankliniella fusca]